MMNNFEKYLEDLAKHESHSFDKLSAREKITVCAGIRLNWMGDFLGNDDVSCELHEITLEKILFSGTREPGWDEILLGQCEKRVENFKSLLESDPTIQKIFSEKGVYTSEPILLRSSEDSDFYTVFDGMHRFVGAALRGRGTIAAYVVEDSNSLPHCEPHVIYDLLRGYGRNARDKEGREDLYHALRLLVRSYGNVKGLLVSRFNESHVRGKDIQEVIQKVLREGE